MALAHQTPDHVFVLGAGIVGLSTAWFLQEEGVQVTVLERDDVAAGSSWGNAGWLAPALTLPLPEPSVLATGIRSLLRADSPLYVPLRWDVGLWRFLLGFARHSTPRAWRRSVRVFNHANRIALGAYDQLNKHDGAGRVAEPTSPAEPFLVAFSSQAERKAFTDELEQVAVSGGATQYELLSGEQMRALQPALGDAVSHGVRLHGQRYINPGRFTHALAEAVRARGGTIRTGQDVRRVQRQGSRLRVSGAAPELAEAEAVVIATGTWLGDLAREHGVRTLVQAGRGYSFTVYPEQVPTGPVYLPGQRVACTPLGQPEGGLRVAGMMEFRPPDDPLDQRRIGAIVKATAPMLRGVDWSARTDQWVGSRPCTADGLPLVGGTATDGVFVAGGHGMWGVALGPLTGKLLAERIVHGQRHELLEAFAPLR